MKRLFQRCLESSRGNPSTASAFSHSLGGKRTSALRPEADIQPPSEHCGCERQFFGLAEQLTGYVDRAAVTRLRSARIKGGCVVAIRVPTTRIRCRATGYDKSEDQDRDKVFSHRLLPYFWRVLRGKGWRSAAYKAHTRALSSGPMAPGVRAAPAKRPKAECPDFKEGSEAERPFQGERSGSAPHLTRS